MSPENPSQENQSVDPGQVWPAVAVEQVEQHEQAREPEPPPVLTGERANIGQQAVNISKCASCDGIHQAVEILDYTRPSPPHTHWYRCPTTGDPVPLALALMVDGNAIELNGPVIQSLARAQLAGRFLIAVWRILPELDENGAHPMKLERHTFKFPPGDFRECLRMLREDLEQEAGPEQPPAMKPAGAITPLHTLAGSALPGPQKLDLSGLVNKAAEAKASVATAPPG